MSNPWLKKNPFMSLWLSAANSIASSARGQITSGVKRQTHAAIAQAGRDAVDLWTGALLAQPKPKPRAKPRRKAKR
jgi:hypothetical protein